MHKKTKAITIPICRHQTTAPRLRPAKVKGSQNAVEKSARIDLLTPRGGLRTSGRNQVGMNQHRVL